MANLKVSTVLPGEINKLFSYVTDYSNYIKAMPADFRLSLAGPVFKMKKGAEYSFKLTRFGVPTLWSVRIEDFAENSFFVEKQTIGMFSSWTASHRFEEHGVNQVRLTTFIEYTMAFGVLGRLFDDLIIRRDLARLIRLTHQSLKKTLEESPAR
jgi:hypothetical protein